jgi:hypothetical protein
METQTPTAWRFHGGFPGDEHAIAHIRDAYGALTSLIQLLLQQVDELSTKPIFDDTIDFFPSGASWI